MQTIKEDVSAEITEKKSKFISNVFYVENRQAAEQKIEEIRKKYHDAKHHCFAYRILEDKKIVERASDDGEPSGTAGAPMLQLLIKKELVNIIVITTRYFGGILLGTGGLVRAYSQAANESLEKARKVSLKKGEKIKIPISYQNLPYLQYYCKKNDISIIETSFENNMYAIIEITDDKKEKFIYEMNEKQFDITKIKVLAKKYIQNNEY